MAGGEEYWTPLIYGVICGVIGSYVGILWLWVFLSQVLKFLPPQASLLTAFISNLVLALILISIPILYAFKILVDSFITYICLLIVGGNKKGFKATFRTYCYAGGAYLFYLIPFYVFPFLGLIWWVYWKILIILGVREGHGISTGKAALAVLLPLIVVLGLIFIAILIPFFFGSVKFFGGVGV